MIPINELTQQQREVLRLLYFSPDHTATAIDLMDRCFFPDRDVTDALEQLRYRNLIHNVELFPSALRPPRWTPSEEMLAQMKLLNSQADAQIRGALDNAKRMLGNGDQ